MGNHADHYLIISSFFCHAIGHSSSSCTPQRSMSPDHVRTVHQESRELADQLIDADADADAETAQHCRPLPTRTDAYRSLSSSSDIFSEPELNHDR